MGESAIRVIPYLQLWQTAAILSGIILLLIIAIILGKMKSILEEQTDAIKIVNSYISHLHNSSPQSNIIQASPRDTPSILRPRDDEEEKILDSGGQSALMAYRAKQESRGR